MAKQGILKKGRKTVVHVCSISTTKQIYLWDKLTNSICYK